MTRVASPFRVAMSAMGEVLDELAKVDSTVIERPSDDHSGHSGGAQVEYIVGGTDPAGRDDTSRRCLHHALEGCDIRSAQRAIPSDVGEDDVTDPMFAKG